MPVVTERGNRVPSVSNSKVSSNEYLTRPIIVLVVGKYFSYALLVLHYIMYELNHLD